MLRKSKAGVAVGGEGVAKLQGRLLGKKLEYCIKFNLSAVGEESSIPIVHHLAAKQLLKEWAEEEGDMKKKEIISLSIESNVVSAHTAYIAIDENQQKPIEGALQTWDLSASGCSVYHMFGAPAGAGGRGGAVYRCVAAPSPKGGAFMGMLKSKKKGDFVPFLL